mmetsp:Transcript_45288/g.83771  ORF Transcript_45288/g.83771 Transcript_45288/m.83771 type:complete len:258 (-) Transcript_45288:123-896(-)
MLATKFRKEFFFHLLCAVGSVLLTSEYALAEENTTSCSLCIDESQPTDPKTRVVLTDATVTCSYLYEIAPNITNATECGNLQSLGTTFCGCGAEPPPPCGLCQDGSELPEPDRVIADGKTCAELEESAMDDFESDCKWWQGLIGPLCGCPGEPPALPDDTCFICPGNRLPKPEKALQLSSGEAVSCIQLQLDANRNGNADCGRFQVLYAEACDCFRDETPTEPRETPSNSAHGLGRKQKMFAGMLVWSFYLGACLNL